MCPILYERFQFTIPLYEYWIHYTFALNSLVFTLKSCNSTTLNLTYCGINTRDVQCIQCPCANLHVEEGGTHNPNLKIQISNIYIVKLQKICLELANIISLEPLLPWKKFWIRTWRRSLAFIYQFKPLSTIKEVILIQ